MPDQEDIASKQEDAGASLTVALPKLGPLTWAPQIQQSAEQQLRLEVLKVIINEFTWDDSSNIIEFCDPIARWIIDGQLPSKDEEQPNSGTGPLASSGTEDL